MNEMIKAIQESGIPETWKDRFVMQNTFTWEEKGWKTAVEWKQTEYGIGVFAIEEIKKDRLVRVSEPNKNCLLLDGKESLPPLTPSTLDYLENYLFQPVKDMASNISYNHVQGTFFKKTLFNFFVYL